MRGQWSCAPRGSRLRPGRQSNHAPPPPDPVSTAVSKGDLATLKALLAAGHDAGSRSAWYDNPLMTAVENNSLEAARMLLEAGADPCNPHYGAIFENTPLSSAVHRGHFEIFRLMWAAVPSEKRSQHEQKPNFTSCLVSAARYGRTSLLEYLLDGWLDSLHIMWSLATVEEALCAAAAAYECHTAMLLLDKVTYTPDTLRRALFCVLDSKSQDPAEPYIPPFKAVDPTNQELLVKRLIEAGQLDPDLCECGKPLIHHAVSAIDLIGALRAVLAKGADPNARDEKGRTALQLISVPIFTRSETEEIGLYETGIHLLLEHGASTTAVDHEGEMPLHAAAFGSDLYTFRRYLGSSLAQDVLSSTNNHGESLLHYAAAGGKVGILRFLLEESPQTNLDVSRANSNGWAPLICALAPSHNNGSFSLPTHDEDSCVEWPYSSGSYAKAGPKTPAEAIQAAQLLLSHGADPSAVTAEGWSALHLLACYESLPGDTRFTSLAEALIHKGAPLQAKARCLTPDWTVGCDWSAAEGYRPEFGGNFPWGFRIRGMAEVASEGVFSAVATTALDWSRVYGSKAVEGVLLAAQESESS